MKGFNKYHWPTSNQHHDPLVTSRDVADKFGITIRQFVSLMRHNPDHPKPFTRSANGAWYRKAEIEKWVSSELERRKEPTKN